MKPMYYVPYVDLSKPGSMYNYLTGHPTYFIANSWNGIRSFAHNVKLYNQQLEGDWTVVLRFLGDPHDCGDLQIQIQSLIYLFEEAHPGYKVAFNGRSGGYLVLYEYNNNRMTSAIPDCLDYDSYEDFKEDIKAQGYAVKDFLNELRAVTKVVRDFDKLCDALREEVNYFSKLNYESYQMAYVVDRFVEEYGDELKALGVEAPVAEEDKIDLRGIGSFNIFLDCLLQCFSVEDRQQITYTKTELRLNEI